MRPHTTFAASSINGRSRTVQLKYTIPVFLLSLCATQADDAIRCRIVGDGEALVSPRQLRIYKANPKASSDIHIMTPKYEDKDGSFRIKRSAFQEGGRWIVDAENRDCLREADVPFFVGNGDFEEHEEAKEITIRLSTKDIVHRPILVVDQSGLPVQSVRVHISCSIPNPSKEGMIWGLDARPVYTDKNGRADIPFVDGMPGTCWLTVLGCSNDKQYMFTGGIWIPLRDLRENGDKVKKWTITKERLCALVSLGGGIDINEGSNGSGVSDLLDGLVTINSNPPARRRITEDGKVRFYGVRAGRYRISICSARGVDVPVSDDSAWITIPSQGSPYVEHVVMVGHKRIQKIGGLVTDELTGDPLCGVSVHALGETILTDENGAYSFALNGPDSRCAIVFRKNGYFPRQREVVRGEAGKEIRLEDKMRPFPILQGRVTVNGSSAASCKLSFSSPEHSVSSECNENGDFRVGILPGQYNVRVRRGLPDGGGRLDPKVGYSVLLDRVFAVAGEWPELDRRDFVIEGVVQVAFRVEVPLGSEPPSMLSFFRESDAVPMGWVRLNGGKDTALLQLPTGKYRALVVLRGKSGTMIPIEIRKEMGVEPLLLSVGKWGAFEQRNDGTLRFDKVRD